MAETVVTPETPVWVPPPTEKRDRSTIDFPYLDLDDAIELARAVNLLGGSSCELVQLAGHLNLALNGGGFRARIVAARIYGVITSERGSVTLTELGKRICDASQEKTARVDAFLAVPLYRAVFEKYRTTSLPPVEGLEAELVALGVAPKQKNKARQVMLRSGRQANFFSFGPDRLVIPPAGKNGHDPKLDGVNGSKPPALKPPRSDEQDLHPFIIGLLRKLPEPETEWPIESRSKWLETAANIFDLMYSDSDDSRRSIAVELRKKDSAK